MQSLLRGIQRLNSLTSLRFFEGLADIDYVKNYDETEDEPIHFVGKVPVVLLNQIQGIATGFRCFIPGHKLSDIVESQVAYLKTGKAKKNQTLVQRVWR